MRLLKKVVHVVFPKELKKWHISMKIAIYRVGCHIYWSRWAYISQDSTATGWKGQMEIFQDFLYSAKAVTHASLAASVG